MAVIWSCEAIAPPLLVVDCDDRREDETPVPKAKADGARRSRHAAADPMRRRVCCCFVVIAT